MAKSHGCERPRPSSGRWVRTIWALCLLAAAGCGNDGVVSPPHVILISIDTVRADHLGCYGYARDTSPNIDALARESVMFSQAFAQASWTLPSHMSVMTSLYPPVHGVQEDDRALGDGVATLAQVLESGQYETAGFISWVYVGKSFGFARGFGEFHELIHRDRLRMASGGGAFLAEEITDRAITWLEKPHPDPFFLFVHYFDPHMDYVPPPPYDRKFDSDYTGPAQGTHAWLGRYIKYFPVPPATLPQRDREHVVALYDGEIAYTDAHLGRLLKAIDEEIGLNNCLLVLMSDHGEEFGDHGSMEGHGWTLYDEVLHVPLIMRLPGGRHAGQVIETPTELISIAPTILSAAGLPIPARFQGDDLLPLITAAQPAGGSALVYAESHRFNISRRALRGARFKLIQTADTRKNSFGQPIPSGAEFYDLDRDPREQQSIFDHQNPVVAHFGREMDAFLERAAREAQDMPRGEPVDLAPEDIELLRSLGYVR